MASLKKKRAESYKILSELASHPIYEGLRMLAPKGLEHHCGPFFDLYTLKPLIEELVKLSIQAGTNYNLLIENETKEIMAAKVYFLEAGGEWFERYYGRPFDRTEIEEIKALLAQLE